MGSSNADQQSRSATPFLTTHKEALGPFESIRFTERFFDRLTHDNPRRDWQYKHPVGGRLMLAGSTVLLTVDIEKSICVSLGDFPQRFEHRLARVSGSSCSLTPLSTSCPSPIDIRLDTGRAQPSRAPFLGPFRIPVNVTSAPTHRTKFREDSITFSKL